jgi:hypothetical protein
MVSTTAPPKDGDVSTDDPRLAPRRRLVSVAVLLGVPALAIVQALHVRSTPSDGFVFTIRQAGLWACCLDLLVLALLDVMLRAQQTGAVHRRSGIKALVMGKDMRSSTSKASAFAWTLALLFVLTFLVLAGRTLVEPSGCGGTDGPSCQVVGVPGLEQAFDRVANQPLDLSYVALLGLPVGAAVAAKALRSWDAATGGPHRQDASGEPRGVVAGCAELVSNDEGEADLVDAQYVLFDAVMLLWFLVSFFSAPAGGLPVLPATLLALRGTSGVAYIAKKRLETRSGGAEPS